MKAFFLRFDTSPFFGEVFERSFQWKKFKNWELWIQILLEEIKSRVTEKLDIEKQNRPVLKIISIFGTVKKLKHKSNSIICDQINFSMWKNFRSELAEKNKLVVTAKREMEYRKEPKLETNFEIFGLSAFWCLDFNWKNFNKTFLYN